MSKILCIVDSYEWALANRARNLKKHLSGNSFTIKHFNDLKGVSFNSFNIVYVLNWPIHGYIQPQLRGKKRYRLVTSVSSHVGREHASRLKHIFDRYDFISTSSNILYREFKPVYKSKVFNTPFGVDQNLFIPKVNPSDLSNKFGWVGNASRDVKRYNDIKSVFGEVGKSTAELYTVTSGKSRAEIASFYNTVGTVICFSKSEGTPNPILEAAASGRSIISTKVGNVPELIKGSSTIEPVSSRSQLKNAILRNVNNPELLNAEGTFLRERILRDWTWAKRSENFRPFLGI